MDEAVRVVGDGAQVRSGEPVRLWPALAALGALPVVLLVAGVLLAALGVLAAGVVLVVLAAALLVAGVAAGSPRRLLGQLGTRPAVPGDEARLVNLVEALCVADGLALPKLRVLEDPAPNALVLGATTRDAVLVVTSGLLGLLDRMELEALVAHELAHVKRKDLSAAAAAMRALALVAQLSPVASRGVQRLAGPSREALADQAAVRVTCYPPALAGALDKLATAGTTRPAGLPLVVARLTGPLWCAPLEEGRPARARAGELDLAERAALLREL